MTSSVVTVVMLVLIAGLALVARQPAPPAIAEFAPQARHQIKQAPQQQTSDIGNAKGAATGHKVPPHHKAAAHQPPPIKVASVKHCYGTPPRQLSFDTQSPPCVAYWQGKDNGGATSQGVTKTSIDVNVYANTPTSSQTARVVEDLQTMANSDFEFYGRQLVLNWEGNKIGNNTNDNESNCQYEYGAAAGLEKEQHPFAVTDPNANSPACFLVGAAQNHIIAASEYSWLTSTEMSQYAPYLYQYPLGYDQQETAMGHMMCSELAGQQYRGQTRKFGAMVQYGFTNGEPSMAPLSAALGTCGQKLANVSYAGFTGGAGSSTGNSAEIAQMELQTESGMIQMRKAGVTTIACFCTSVADTLNGTSAETQLYHPQWILDSAWGNDYDFVVHTLFEPPDQRAGLLGMSFYPPQVPYPNMTLNQALAQVDPGFQVDAPSLAASENQAVYYEILLLASGIQMAGPHLTPTTFEHGLQTAKFPDAENAEREGPVDFLNGDHTMTDDATLMWWNELGSGPYPDNGVGAWCYVDGGARFDLVWPKGLPLFKGKCDSSPPGS